MDINELRKNPHLSPSAISDYMDCGLQYKERSNSVAPKGETELLAMLAWPQAVTIRDAAGNVLHIRRIWRIRTGKPHPIP